MLVTFFFMAVIVAGLLVIILNVLHFSLSYTEHNCNRQDCTKY